MKYTALTIQYFNSKAMHGLDAIQFKSTSV